MRVKFKLVMDYNAFTKTLDKKYLSTRVARWVLLLQDYDYVFEHVPERKCGTSTL